MVGTAPHVTVGDTGGIAIGGAVAGGVIVIPTGVDVGPTAEGAGTVWTAAVIAIREGAVSRDAASPAGSDNMVETRHDRRRVSTTLCRRTHPIILSGE